MILLPNKLILLVLNRNAGKNAAKKGPALVVDLGLVKGLQIKTDGRKLCCTLQKCHEKGIE